MTNEERKAVDKLFASLNRSQSCLVDAINATQFQQSTVYRHVKSIDRQLIELSLLVNNLLGSVDAND